MSAHVIQHTRPRRKHVHARSWTARHLVLLIVIITAIIAASWLAPEIAAPPAPTTAPQMAPAPQASATPETPLIDIAADLAGPAPSPVRVRQTVRHTGVPLDAAVTAPDDYEILSAAELDGISQARN
ncbi:MAG: hypothetical protein ABL932_03615 [Terricaulis sp.]